MATPQVVGTAVSGTVQGAASLTLSVTVPAGDNRALLVGCGFDLASATPTITYGGVALAQIGDEHLNVSSSDRIQLWALLAPAVGTADLVLTLPGTAAYIGMWAQPLDTVAQTDAFGVVTLDRDGLPAVVAAAVGNLVMDATGSYRGSDYTPTPGAGQTLIADVNNLPSNDLHTMGSYQVAAATSVNQTYTFTPSANPYMVAVAINGAGEGPEPPSALPLLLHHRRQQGGLA